MRKAVLALVLAVLTACGFQPMYAPAHTDVQMSNVYVKPIPERDGQMLRNALLDRGFSNEPGPDKYELVIPGVGTIETALGIAQDNTATRKQMTMSLSMALNKDGEEVFSRNAVSRATYNVLQSQYTTIVSQESGRRMVVEDLARQVETQVVLALDGKTK